ncbi:hypothetical protein ACFPRL_25700 [Pseudoclavibacter helvolus]
MSVSVVSGESTIVRSRSFMTTSEVRSVANATPMAATSAALKRVPPSSSLTWVTGWEFLVLNCCSRGCRVRAS